MKNSHVVLMALVRAVVIMVLVSLSGANPVEAQVSKNPLVGPVNVTDLDNPARVPVPSASLRVVSFRGQPLGLPGAPQCDQCAVGPPSGHRIPLGTLCPSRWHYRRECGLGNGRRRRERRL